MSKRQFPSVTQVIQPHMDFSAIPEEVLAAAQVRGTEFHSLAARHAEGLWIDEIPESCAGFFKSFREWFDAHVTEVVLVETQLTHEVYHYTGTPDAIVRIKGSKGLVLIDWKTPRVFSKSWRVQLAAYRVLAEKAGYPIERVASLQPHPTGGRAMFKDSPYDHLPDFTVFLSLLNCWRFFHEG